MQNPQTAATHLKKISSLRPTLAIVLGSGFHHALKSPLPRGDFRALATFDDGRYLWFWIGTHDEYERIIRNL